VTDVFINKRVAHVDYLRERCRLTFIIINERVDYLQQDCTPAVIVIYERVAHVDYLQQRCSLAFIIVIERVAHVDCLRQRRSLFFFFIISVDGVVYGLAASARSLVFCTDSTACAKVQARATAHV
jgi:hypothetical protein